MKITKKTKSTRKIMIIIACIALFGIVGVTSAVYFNKNQNKVSNEQKPNQSDQSQDVERPKLSDEEISNQEAKDKQDFLDNQKNPSAPTPKPDLIDDSVSFVVSSDSKSLIIQTKLKKFSGTGSCTLNLRNDSAEVSERSTIIYQPEFSTCAGFAIDRSKLKNGKWSIDLIVESDGKTVQKSSEYTL